MKNPKDIESKNIESNQPTSDINNTSNQLSLIRAAEAKKYQTKKAEGQAKEQAAEKEKELKKNLDDLKNVYLTLIEFYKKFNLPDLRKNKKYFLDKIFKNKDTYHFEEGKVIINNIRNYLNSLGEYPFHNMYKLINNVNTSLTNLEISITNYLKHTEKNNYDDRVQLYKTINFYKVELKNSIEKINHEIIKFEYNISQQKLAENSAKIPQEEIAIVPVEPALKEKVIHFGQKNDSLLLSLPDELLLNIFTFFDQKTLLKLRLICSSLKDFVDDPELLSIEKILHKKIVQFKNSDLENCETMFLDLNKALAENSTLSLKKEQRYLLENIFNTAKQDFIKKSMKHFGGLPGVTNCCIYCATLIALTVTTSIYTNYAGGVEVACDFISDSYLFNSDLISNCIIPYIKQYFLGVTINYSLLGGW